MVTQPQRRRAALDLDATLEAAVERTPHRWPQRF